MHNLLHAVRLLFSFLSQRRRRELAALILLLLLSSASEGVSLASILPLISTLSNPSSPESNYLFNTLFSPWPFIHSSLYPVLTVILFCALITTSTFIRIYSLRFILNFSSQVGNDIASFGFQELLYDEYVNHLSKNSSQSISVLSKQVDDAVNGFILPCLNLVSYILFSLFVSLVILCTAPFIFLALIFVFFSSYTIISNVASSKLQSNSRLHSRGNTLLVKLIQESVGSISDIIIGKNQLLYVTNFRAADKTVRSAISSSAFLASYPRHAIETIAVLSLVFYMLYLLMIHESILSLLPQLSVFVLGALKLFPAAQNIYSSYALILANSQSVLNVQSFSHKSSHSHTINHSMYLLRKLLVFQIYPINTLARRVLPFKTCLLPSSKVRDSALSVRVVGESLLFLKFFLDYYRLPVEISLLMILCLSLLIQKIGLLTTGLIL
jgi:hypothetical protein